MFTKKILSNNMRFIKLPLKNTKIATVLVLVKVGSKFETKEISGISHFLEHMFFKGTEKRPNKLLIAKTLDQIGGEYNAFTAHEYTGFYAKVNGKHLTLAMDVISDILLNSKFDENEINREKGVIIEEINMYQDNPMEYIDTLWTGLLFGDQPAGWDILGKKETVLKMNREKILSYYKKYYTPANILICLSGDLSGLKFQKNIEKVVAEKYFKYNGLISTVNKSKLEKINQKDPKVSLLYKKTDQTHLMLGVRSYNIFHPDLYNLKLLSVILGGGMSSRLFMEIRENRGLAYYIYTRNDSDTDAGYLVSGAGLDNSKVEEAVKVIIDQYYKIKSNGINADELKKAKDCLKGRMLLNLETSSQWANFFASQELLKEDILNLKDIFAKIDKITVDDIKRTANDIFVNNKLNLALIGPFKDIGKFEKILRF